MTTKVDYTHSRLREIWRSMLKRCENPNCKDYHKYGGHFIKVCPEWHDFDTFKAWALAHHYNNKMTLDRICNNKGYEPGNCRWITRKAQAYNRTTNKRYTIDGKTRTLTEWCEEYGLTADVVIHRLDKGWSEKDALTTPKRAKRKEGE